MFPELYSLQSIVSIGSCNNAVRYYYHSHLMDETFVILRNEVTAKAERRRGNFLSGMLDF